ncbi:MAG TPA: globin [Nitrospiria bacterium]|nr:globin [Nitrospiria bacterium]
MDVDEVLKSFRRVPEGRLADRFYEIFLKTDPRFKPLFAKTDFERQKELLVHGIFALLEYAKGSATGRMAVRRLGELHSRKRMNITKDMYPVWVFCLIQALREVDPQFTPLLETQWREALQKGIDLMVEME